MNTLTATKNMASGATRGYMVMQHFAARAFTGFYEFLDKAIVKTYKLLILIAWAGVGLMLYWEFIDVGNPITKMYYHNYVFFTPAGSTLANGIRYDKTYCFNKDSTLTVFPTLSNSVIYNLPNRGELFYKAGCNTQPISIIIPPEFPNGVYNYRAEYEIQVNPLRKIRHQYNVFTLTIIDAAHGKYKVDFTNKENNDG